MTTPKNLDEIALTGLEFFGFHGCFPEEKKQGQLFVVDVNIKLSLAEAGKSDNLNDTVDYAKVTEIVKNKIEGEPKNLIESVAETIANEILKKFDKAEEVAVTLHKPHVSLRCVIKDVAVKVVRKK